MDGPRLYRPRPPLADHIEYFGYWERGGAIDAHVSRALPRGAATVIIDVGDRKDLGFYAADGSTRLSVPPAFIVGPGVDSYVTRVQPTQTVMTIHFRPAGALPFVGCPLDELEDACVDVADLWGPSAESLLEQLIETCSARRRVALLETFLCDRMRSGHTQPEVASIMVAAEQNPSMRVSEAHDSTGLSPKQFNALFRSRVGLSPKAYLRVRRLQAALRALDTATPGARIAADLGYFDQAHFVREFQAFAAITPTQYTQRPSSMPGHVEVNETPRARNIQAKLRPGIDYELMDTHHRAVADTGLLVAAIRARESTREDSLFCDPFAERLAGKRGRELLAGALAASGDQSTAQIVVRTRFWDEALLEAVQEGGQVVIVAAGMDARAYRLPWPDGTVVYELDQPEVISAKDELLAGENPGCRRVPVAVDLAEDWPAAIRSAGLNSAAPTVWLLEGLLQYLDENAVDILFDRIDALSASGSVLLYEVVGQSLFESPSMAPVLESMAQNGAPWLFGSDEPEQLAVRRGWSATVIDIAEVGNRYDRWFAPAIPMNVAGVPRGYFVTATK